MDRFCRGEGTDALMHAKDGQNIILHDKWDEMPFLNISETATILPTIFSAAIWKRAPETAVS